MKKTLLPILALVGALIQVSCQPAPYYGPPPRVATMAENEQAYLSQSKDDYATFIASNNYPKNKLFYKDEALVKKANSRSPIFICLEQQRGRLYVNGCVAADWPVSTGTSSHPTPVGKFTIILKKPSHNSSRYGRIYNAAGKSVNGNADIYNDAVPEGGKFVGSSMPYWMRMTSDGVGMHVGRVVPGRRLSHGCIRLPRQVAQMLYSKTAVRVTPVSVVNGYEKQLLNAVGKLYVLPEQELINPTTLKSLNKVLKMEFQKQIEP